jgi:DHA1 family multidrug resistance protein-like MFS transporter
MDLWRRNLVVIWTAQFISTTGFFFARPFAPFFIQELGVTDPGRLEMAVAAFGASAPLSLALFSPIWGALADRYGRRLMLLRANFGGAATLLVMGMSQSVGMLLVMRVIQGMFAGTVAAAQSLASASAPEDRTGLALGAVTSSVFTGTMAGYFLGGILAEAFGYRIAFFLAAGMLTIGGLLVAFGVVENFTPPPRSSSVGRRFAAKFRPPVAPGVGVIFVLIAAVAMTRHFDLTFFPLVVQTIWGSLDGAAFWTGAISSVGSVAGFLAGMLLGRIADRRGPMALARAAAVAGGAVMLAHYFVSQLFWLFPLRFGVVFCSAGLELLYNVWLAKITRPENRGAIFGWSASCRALGWVAAPLVSGGLAAAFGLKAIYIGGAMAYIGLLWMTGWAARRIGRAQMV